MRMRIAVAMSGGVDSAGAACLLSRQEGTEVFGVTLNLWNYDGPEGRPHSCCRPEDIRDARRAAAQIGIPHYVLDYTVPFRRDVVDRFASEYASGRTPSPCILCNTHIKFGRFLDEAGALGADRLATGHYARIVGDRQAGLRLARARHVEKDQSYFLFELNQRQLSRIAFPLGDMTKSDVRRVLEEAGVSIHEKPESQEICFVGGTDYASFLARHYGIGEVAGAMVGPGGQALGEHHGVHLYTVGQRKGLGLSGPRPYYVTRVDASRREVHIGLKEDTYRSVFRAIRVSWAGGEPKDGEYQVQIRSRHSPAQALVKSTGDAGAVVEFCQPQSAITPGQAAVFYDEDRVEGGGWIAEVIR